MVYYPCDYLFLKVGYDRIYLLATDCGPQREGIDCQIGPAEVLA